MLSTSLWHSSSYEAAQVRHATAADSRSVARALLWNLALAALLLLDHQLCLLARLDQPLHVSASSELLLCRCGLSFLLLNASVLLVRYGRLRHRLSAALKRCDGAAPAAALSPSPAPCDSALITSMYFPSMHRSRQAVLLTSSPVSPMLPSPKAPLLSEDKVGWPADSPSGHSSPLSGSGPARALHPSRQHSFLGLDASGRDADLSLSNSGGALPFSPGAGPGLRTIDYSPLRHYSYQVATPDPTPSKSMSLLEASVGGATGGGATGAELLQNANLSMMEGGGAAGGALSLSRAELEAGTERLRRWLHGTILCRLVAEVDAVNAKMVDLGHEELRVGEARVDTLRLLAQRPHAQHLPSLGGLLPFLECSPHQGYLLQRLRQLAVGGALGVYRWSAGCSAAEAGADPQVQAWREPLPPDAVLVMHLFATYMDARLPGQPRCPEGRSFSSLHLLRMGDKADGGSGEGGLGQHRPCLAIRQTAERPPHFNLVLGGGVAGAESAELEVVAGSRNAFYAILLFLEQVRSAHKGYLHRINLGATGLNILWVLRGEEPLQLPLHQQPQEDETSNKNNSNSSSHIKPSHWQ